MDAVSFNEAKDRIFSVGDLVDRGQKSSEALEWIRKPWFHAVRGNHEQMCIDAARGIADGALHAVNGGLWFYSDLSEEQRQEFAEEFERLPIAIEIETGRGLVGIVHAEGPGAEWSAFRSMSAELALLRTLWGRDVIRGRVPFSGVSGVVDVYVGHTPVADELVMGNVHYIDTGAVFGKRLTLKQITHPLDNP